MSEIIRTIVARMIFVFICLHLDVDECALHKHNCTHGQRCENMLGSFRWDKELRVRKCMFISLELDASGREIVEQVIKWILTLKRVWVGAHIQIVCLIIVSICRCG